MTSTTSKWIRRTGRALACAGAVAGGAAIAAITSPPPSSALAPVDPPAPMVLASTLAPPSNDPVEPAPRVHRPAPSGEVPLVPMFPFAERLRDGRVITGATPHRIILFTFDDGPDPRHTPRLLDVLDEHGVKAVFFLTASRIADGGPWQRRNQAIARDIVARGHIIGNHTLTHPQLPLLDDAQVIEEVEGAERIFEDVLGERTWLMRPPGGARSARVDALLAERGYTQMHWNVGSGDFQVREAEEVFRTWRRVLHIRERDFGERGGIVLLHDTHEWSVDAVPRILSYLRERNCELLETDEELYDIVSDPTPFFSPRGHADPSEVAPPAAFSEEVVAARQRALRAETERRCQRLASR